MSHYLYDLKKLLDPAESNLRNSFIDPNSAAAYELLTRARNIVINELQKMEAEENRLDAIPLIKSPAPEPEPAPAIEGE